MIALQGRSRTGLSRELCGLTVTFDDGSGKVRRFLESGVVSDERDGKVGRFLESAIMSNERDGEAHLNDSAR